MTVSLSFNGAMREKARAWVSGWQHADRIAFTKPYTYHAVPDEVVPVNNVLWAEFIDGLFNRVFCDQGCIERLTVRLQQLGELEP